MGMQRYAGFQHHARTDIWVPHSGKCAALLVQPRMINWHDPALFMVNSKRGLPGKSNTAKEPLIQRKGDERDGVSWITKRAVETRWTAPWPRRMKRASDRHAIGAENPTCITRKAGDTLDQSGMSHCHRWEVDPVEFAENKPFRREFSWSAWMISWAAENASHWRQLQQIKISEMIGE